MGLVAALALILTAAAAVARPEASRGRFDDVVRAPDTASAALAPPTRLSPDPSQVLTPASGMTARLWLRVSADGRMIDASAPVTPDGLRDPLVAAAAHLLYTPALHPGQPVATASAIYYQLARKPVVQAQVGSSDDVAWLEQIAASAVFARRVWQTQSRPLGQPKDLRIIAYARLGELGTEESVAAQERIRAQFTARPVIDDAVNLTETWPHPGWHMSDYHPAPLAQMDGRDGKRFVTFSADLLGAPQVFLVTCDDAASRCSRPKPFGAWQWRYVKVDASLEEVSAGRLRLTLRPMGAAQQSIMDGTAPIERDAQPPLKPQTRDIVIADVERDSDSDGWTDIEEQTLGLDPASRDSDRDGIDDAHDRAPLYAPPKTEAGDEESLILRAAVFAAFGLTGSRWVLFAKDEQVRKLEVPGLSAPVLFDRPLRFDPRVGGPGGVFVTWKIVRKSVTDAMVEISDWEGPLAAGGQQVFLRRIAGQWIVMGRQTTWIS